MNDIIVKAEGLSKSFRVSQNEKTLLRSMKMLVKQNGSRNELCVLKHISFEIKDGDKVAVVGRNGCGKTTLLRILTGIYDQTAGHLEVKGAPVSLFSSSVGTYDELSVIDNVYLFGAMYGLSRNFLKNKTDEILAAAEISHLTFSPLKELSLGQRGRFAFSVFSQVDGDFFIFDESLASVDKGFIEKCEEYFRKLFQSKKTIIMSSHNANFLKDHCKRAIWIDEGRIRMSGETGEVIDSYENSFCKGV